MPPPPDRGGRPSVFTIPASVDFADALAQGLMARIGAGAMALADATIYLPTRRAARSIAEVFARNAGGASLLPQFLPLGDVEEDEILPGDDGLDLPRPMAPLRRQLLLAALVRRWSHARDGGTMSFAQAASLARSLAGVMDEVERAGADLGKLGTLAPEALAEHWAEVVEFLSLLSRQWPPLLAAEGCINPSDHRNRALRALAERLAATAPDRPIVAAGSTGTLPATSELMAVIARLPQGAVVLPGLDRELDAESWERLEPNHPQFALKQLLGRLGIARQAVKDWTEALANGEREQLLREVLRPAPTTDAWRALAEQPDPLKPDGLSLFEAADPAEEAAVVALLLRKALETPKQRAALVTRDRGLARRVTAELRRWAIAIDDSAGRPLPRTPAGSFLCLLAEAVHDGFSPVPLLALLKHPLATMGDGAFRAHVRDLDRALRGPRPDEGLAGITKALTNANAPLQRWWARVHAVLAPLQAALAAPEVDLGKVIEAFLAAAEALAPALWNNTDGAAANSFFCALRDGAETLPPIEAKAFAPLLSDLMQDVPVRPSFGKHPRLAILGPLEARLLRFDLVILGGLNEGSWPAAATDDPWFSRPMRAVLGLDPPERSIGLAAHDFAGLAAAPHVVLTRSQKADGTPMVASRWIQRLQQLAAGLGIAGKLALDPSYRAIAEAMADPGPLCPQAPPYPRPPVEARPRALSVTDVEKWIRDPYAIYAKKVLRLKPLDPLDAEIGPRQRGTAFHSVLERFLRTYPDLPPDAAMQMGLIVDQVFDALALPQAIVALWRPRFLRAARWFVAEERKLRPLIAESHLELRGEIAIAAPAGAFTLHGIADRIDRMVAGGATIIDYKTGTPPSGSQVKVLLSPQLPLEAAILAHGGFAGMPALAAAALTYIHISGGTTPGKVQSIDADAAALAEEALARLSRRIALFDRETTGYESRVAPEHVDSVGDYDHLARVREWSLSGWSGE